MNDKKLDIDWAHVLAFAVVLLPAVAAALSQDFPPADALIATVIGAIGLALNQSIVQPKVSQ